MAGPNIPTCSSLDAASIVSSLPYKVGIQGLASQSEREPRKDARMAHQAQSIQVLLERLNSRGGLARDLASPDGSVLRAELMVIVEHLIGDMLPAKFPGALAGRHSQPSAFVLIIQQMTDCPGQLLVILGSHQQPIPLIANHRAEAGNIRRYDCPARGHSLQQDDTLALAARIRRAEDIRCGIERWELFRRDAPQEDDIAPSRLGSVRLEANPLRPIAADQKARVGIVLADDGNRAQQILQPLALLQPPQKDDVEAIIAGLRVLSERRDSFVETPQIDAVGNDAILAWEEARD